MFKYRSHNDIKIDQLYCLLLTSVIASNNGFDKNLDTTEIVPRNDILAEFYRAYYYHIAGAMNENTKHTDENHLTMSKYNSEYYDVAQNAYDKKNGADMFSRLSELDRFKYIFQAMLLPVVSRSVASKMVSNGVSSKDADELSKKFRSDFYRRFVCMIEEFFVLYTTPRQMWIQLYDYAMDMPHVVIGLRKQVSSYDSVFFRENKDRLQSIIPFMKAKKLHASNFTDGFSIAGMIVNEFKMRGVQVWMGQFAGTISSGSGTYVDSDGVLLWGSELNEKMFSNARVINIERFDDYMRAIDKGSFLYTINGKGGPTRYFNLIEWRQNKIKGDIVNSMKGSALETKLSVLGLRIGGVLVPDDIGQTMGTKSGDKPIRFRTLDRMIQEAYDANIDSVMAQSLIDKWFEQGVKAYETGESENGRFPMNFTYRKNDPNNPSKKIFSTGFYTYNKQKFRELIQGVTALKALEAAIRQMDYTFMSFPVYGYENSPHELITGVSLSDYLNQIKAIDTNVEIESDITYDRELEDDTVIENISGKASEVLRALTRQKFTEKISLGTLTDDELALSVDRESDRELLHLLKSNGVDLKIGEDSKSTTIHDIVFENISDSVRSSMVNNLLTPSDATAKYTNFRNKVSKDMTGYIMTRLRYVTRVLCQVALYGGITHGVGVNALKDKESFRINNEEDIFLDICYSLGKRFNDSFVEALRDGSFYEQWLANEFSKSGFMYKGEMSRVPRLFLKNDGSFNVWWKFLRDNIGSITGNKFGENGCSATTTDFVDVLCKVATNETNRIAETEFNIEDKYYLPRAICFCINVSVIIDYVITALAGIVLGIRDLNNDKKDVNSDDTININLLLKSLSQLEKAYSPNNSSDRFGVMKTYEDVYEVFFDAVNFEVDMAAEKARDNMYNDKGLVYPNSFNKKSKPNSGFYRFVFMDSIQRYDSEFNDIDERLLQYREVTKVVHLLLTNKTMYNIKFGNANYTIKEFVNLLQRIFDVDKANADKEYFVDSVAMTVIDGKKQKAISDGIASIVQKDGTDNLLDESNTWLENLLDFCASKGIVLNNSLIRQIRVNADRYKINEYQLVELDNKVLHTIIHEANGDKTVVLSWWGVFGYDGSTVTRINKMGDFRWLLH